MAKEKKYIVTASSLNIRSGPGTDYEILDSASQGDRVLSPNTEGWVPIFMDDDTTGWVFGKYLQPAPAGEPEVGEKREPKPSQFDFPIMQEDLEDLFGEPNYGQFQRKNVVKIDLSQFATQLAHVRTYEGKPFTSVYGHYLLEAPLKRALQMVCDKGLAGELKTYSGCFNIRPMKSSNSYSVHSWALALDFNAETNPFQNPAPDYEDMERDLSDEFVKCFAEAGFEWGGLWRSIKDPMHFQLAWTQDWQESEAPLRPKVFVEKQVEPKKLTVPPVGFDFSTKEGTIEAIKAECQKQGLGQAEQIAYVLATVQHETGGTFKPVREAFYVSKDFDTAEAWRQNNLRYYPYYGRGYVQLTWEANYKKYGDILGIDLVNEPDLAIEPNNALFILVHGMKTGAFTGKKLSDYTNTDEIDFYNARKVINGLDQAQKIAKIAESYLA
jgi:predicted chitinase